MNNYEDWAQLVAKKLEHESTLLAAIDKDEFDDSGASEAFVRAVIEPFMPENYGIGSGRIVDAFGNMSDYLEIIVYNRDFPRIGMRGTHSAFLYESVLAAFSIRAKFVRKSFFDALNACASIADLETNTDKAALVKLAAKNGLKAGPNKTFVHDDPLRAARFQLIGRPPAFVFGFSGFKYSYRQLQENLELWLQNRVDAGTSTPMKALPAVIATQGCFAWRNAAPLALSNREMMGIGNDSSPIRLIVLQLLYLLNRRLQVSTDGYGLKPTLSAYLSQFSAPKFEVGVGNVAQIFDLKPGSGSSGQAGAESEKPAVAKPAAAKQVAPRPATQKSAAQKPAGKPAAPAAAPATAARAAKPAVPESSSGVFDKPSPFASKPKPPAQTESAAPEPRRFSAPSAPLGSAPIPGLQKSAPEADRTPPRAPLGSAPIPPSREAATAAPEAERTPPRAPLGSAPIPASGEPGPAAGAAQPKPPVDFDIGSSADAKPASHDDFVNTVVIPPDASAAIREETRKAAPEAARPEPEPEDGAEDEFASTVVIPPDASASSKDKQHKSGDDFIARVKKQLSSPERISDDEMDFTSTIPQ